MGYQSLINGALRERIERPNQVWCADITYIPVQGGFLYLVAIMDWAAGGCWLAVVQHDGHRVLALES